MAARRAEVLTLTVDMEEAEVVRAITTIALDIRRKEITMEEVIGITTEEEAVLTGGCATEEGITEEEDLTEEMEDIMIAEMMAVGRMEAAANTAMTCAKMGKVVVKEVTPREAITLTAEIMEEDTAEIIATAEVVKDMAITDPRLEVAVNTLEKAIPVVNTEEAVVEREIPTTAAVAKVAAVKEGSTGPVEEDILEAKATIMMEILIRAVVARRARRRAGKVERLRSPRARGKWGGCICKRKKIAELFLGFCSMLILTRM
jgi:hypothetical protein